MQESTELFERRTTADVVFEQLYGEIASLELLPGTKLSEADVARRFGVSRQPVREALSRLGNLELVLVRPQRATIVRGFSLQRVAYARFVRLAIELEVITQACAVWDASCTSALQRNLDLQHKILETEPEQFHSLDLRFHLLICELAGCPLAAEAITECRQKIDRLCTLSLARQSEAATLLADHEKLAKALQAKSVDRALAITRQHLSRLDSTIKEIHSEHSEYFE